MVWALTRFGVACLILSPGLAVRAETIRGTWKLDRPALVAQLTTLITSMPEFHEASVAEQAEAHAAIRKQVDSMADNTIVITGSRITVKGPSGAATGEIKVKAVEGRVIKLLKTAGGETLETSIRVTDADHITLVAFADGHDIPMRRARERRGRE